MYSMASRHYIIGLLWFICTLLVCQIVCKGPTACVYDKNNRPICWCFGGYANCSGQNLTYIPYNIPRNTQILNLSSNSLTHLDNKSFEKISTTSPNLVTLDVSKNQIVSADSKCLYPLKALKTFDASFNDASNPVLIVNLTHNVSGNLELLLLESMKLTNVSSKVFKNLEHTNLKNVSFKNNFIKKVDDIVFSNLKTLEHLDLSYNLLGGMDISLSTSLKSLILSSNHLTGLPVCCNQRKPGLPSLEAIYLDDNCIRTLHMERINCLSNLKWLNISNTQIERIPSGTFAKLKSLQMLTIEKTESLDYSDSYAFKSKSLVKIYLSKNRMGFKNGYIDNATIFKGVPALTNLDLSHNEMNHMRPNHWFDMLCNATGITYLDVTRTGLFFAPLAFPQCLLKLKFLGMSGNWIRYLPPGYFIPLQSLKVLFLNENKLAVFSALDFPPSFVNHLSQIDLSFNPFICDCKLIFFLHFAKKYKNIIIDYPTNYECYDGTVISNLEDVFTPKSCLLQSKVKEIIKCTSVSIMFLLVLTSVIYRYRWKLRYMLFVLKFQRRKCSNNSNLSHVHDVYVSSSDHDFDIVYNHLVSELENKGLNVFFPNRDAKPGSIVIRESLEHLDSSKHVLLCVSNAYAQDNWCEFETCMALERSIYDHGDDGIIVVILLEEIDCNNVTKIIDSLTRSGDYLKWDDNLDTTYLFWRKLEQKLQHRTNGRPRSVPSCPEFSINHS